MSKIKLTGESSGYVEISAGNAAGNNTLEAPTSGTRLVAHEGSQDVTLNGNLTVNGVVSYEDVTNIDSVGVMTARSGLQVTSGHIGVGVTPESWSTNLKAVQIGRQACITGQTNHNIVEISANAYHNSGIWKYIETDTATSYYQYQGDHVFSSAPSGTADDAITFSEKLRITSGGQSKFTVGTNKYVKIYAASHNDEADLGAGIAFSRPSDGADMLSGMFSHSNTGLGIAARDHITFLTGGTSNVSDTEERLRITSGGALLVAKTTTSLTTQGSRIDNGLITVSGDSSSTNLATNSGGNLSLANIDSTDNNFSNIGGYNSNGLVVSQIDFINKSHSSRTGDIAFLTHNGSAMSERLRITSAGNIGIGINNPAYELEVASSDTTTFNITAGGNTNLSRLFFSDDDAVARGYLNYDHQADSLLIATAGSERLRITSDGQLLHTRSDNTTRYDLEFRQTGGITDGNYGGIHWTQGSTGSTNLAAIEIEYANNGRPSIVFKNRQSTGTAMSEAARIDSGARLGVQTNDPKGKIHIGGAIGSFSNDANTAHTSLIIKQTNNDNKSGFYIERSGERKGYYMWMNPGGGSGDGLTFTRNNAGTKTDALILDRDANIWGGGTFYPLSDNSYDLGSASNRWRNVYTTDLQLSNEGSQNDIDGTWGSYTIQEGEDELFLINRRNGKKYKFNLTEVN